MSFFPPPIKKNKSEKNGYPQFFAWDRFLGGGRKKLENAQILNWVTKSAKFSKLTYKGNPLNGGPNLKRGEKGNRWEVKKL